MGKKGRKTRWRKLPIPIGTGNGRGGWEEAEADEPKRHQPPQPVSPTTFNEDEYTRITTPRQDMLFKKGYLGKKKTSNPPQDTTDTQSAGDSVESESYACDETANQYIYSGGYVDPTGMYYLNNGYEMYDPYTGAVTVIVGPGPQNGYGPQVLAAVPCAPLPLQPLEWFNPAAPQPPFSLPPNYLHRKKRSSVDSQNCSGQSSETTCNPGSPPEPTEGVPDANGQPFYPPQYVYPGAYMFGAPLYNMNGVSVQGMVPPATAPPPADPAKRRKKRRRRRRGGAVTDEGSESSCEEVSCEAGNESQSGASSDTALGSSSSKTNSDSGIHTDPTANSGSNSPQILETNYYYPMSPTENLVEPPKSPEPTVTSHGKVPEEPQEQAELNCTTEPVTELEATSESLATISCDFASEEVFTVSSQPCDESILRLEEQVEHLEESHSLPESTFEQTQEVTSSCHNEPVLCPEPTQDLSEPTLDQLIPEVLQTPVPIEEVDHQHIQEEHEPQSTQNEESATHIETQAFCLLELKENLPQELQDDTITSLTCETKIDVGLEEEQCTSDFASTPASPLSPAEEYYTSDETDPIPLSPTLVHSEPQSPTELVESATAEIETTSTAVQIEEVCSKAEQMEEVCSKAVQMEEVCNKIDSGLFEPDSIRVEEVEAYQVILNEDRVSDRPITEAVTKWLESQGSRVLSSSIVAEGERIEEGIDPLTGQKNGEGNPFLASSPSDSRTRVAKTNVRDVLNEETRVRAMCDPKSSVEKYYRLAAETASDKSAPPSSGQKTAMHFGRAGPFPCGVCCILQ